MHLRLITTFARAAWVAASVDTSDALPRNPDRPALDIGIAGVAGGVVGST
jgi:hypothetical protein